MDFATGASVFQIVWINLVLSGDNAMVIALACRSLGGPDRSRGIVLGALAAVLLRIVFTLFLSQVLLLPYAHAIGGVLLLVIAIKILVGDDSGEAAVAGHDSLFRAIGTIMVADIVMSLDNVIAIAAAANGSATLIVLGLGLSVPIVAAGSALIVEAIRRFPIIVWGGAAFLGWIAGQTLSRDEALHATIGLRINPVAVAAAGTALVIVVGTIHRLTQGRRTVE